MPLLDHFHPPLSERRHWHSFHHAWATYLSSQINSLLPEGYFAEANVQYSIEIDVATIREDAAPLPVSQWTPPEPQLSVPLPLSGGVIEINIFSQSGGPTLAGSVELVSPSNKDRPSSREAFVSKCATYLQAGVGLVIVDVVTERNADLHLELMNRLGVAVLGGGPPLYSAAYRPVERDKSSTLDVWHQPLAIGQPLPTMPLCLRGNLCVPVELEATYERTCREQRVTAAA